MKRIVLHLLAVLLLSLGATAQTTATNFIADDCDGNSHNLFAELNSGKVIVIAWVMPCAGCLPASQTAYEIVQLFAVTHPGQVRMYVADDYANTPCSTIDTWVFANAMDSVTTFSDSALDMTAYGGVGMPKIIVLGGGFNHTVYFNENNIPADDSTGIHNAIDSALADITGLAADLSQQHSSTLFPNPANDQVVLTVHAEQAGQAQVQVFNVLGETVLEMRCVFVPGENRFTLNVNALSGGTYFVKVNDGEKSSVQKLIIAH